MKKQELIEKINAIPWDEGLVVDTLKINRAGLLQLIEQLDEPQKVTIPQFVADWIEVCKEHLTSSLYLAMTPSFLKTNNQGIELTVWIKKNEETFALAWINGYEVEKEKRYRVKMKGIDKTSYLNHDILKKTWFFSIEHDGFTVRTHHTRKELEGAGFGWVFDCPGMEVEEVQE